LNASSWITNSGGVYQFTTATPTITTNGSPVVLTNGTVSFRNVSDANVFANVAGSGNQLTNIIYQGNNTFRLNNSSNTTAVAQNYTFKPGSGTNYAALEMVNGGTLWRSEHLTVDTGGSLVASNTVGRIEAAVTNIGLIEVYHSTMTFVSNVVISGTYRSDPSTNVFLSNVFVTNGGVMVGSQYDLFDFQKNLIIQTTNNQQFDLSKSVVQFSGGGVHTNAILGQDFGAGASAPQGFAASNFSYGVLRVGATNDDVCFQCGLSPTQNALYVEWLDLTGLTNYYGSVSNMIVDLLHSPTNIDLYYALANPANDYLGGLTYQLLDCNGLPGGLLIGAIPEPNSLTLLFLGACSLLALRQRKGPSA
jgi:hypothetical protein